jgi:hypothetical protein
LNEFGTGVGELGDAFDDFSIGKRKITGTSLDNYAKVLRDIRDWEFPWGKSEKEVGDVPFFSLSLSLSFGIPTTRFSTRWGISSAHPPPEFSSGRPSLSVRVLFLLSNAFVCRLRGVDAVAAAQSRRLSKA